MELIIREYLSLLKESGEFDKLLSDLLFVQGIIPISKPQVGVRQGGVDIAAVTDDALYLLVIKVGNIGRADWDAGSTAIRQSLDEIKDIYLQSHVAPEHKNLSIKIILCTTGVLKQDTQTNWAGYVSRNETANIKYEIWNGDEIANQVEQHLLNEYLFSDNSQAVFRKTLALIATTEYDLSHFYELLNELLVVKLTNAQDKKKTLIRSFRVINLMLNIMFRWAESEGNLCNIIPASERVLLWCWEAMRVHNYLDDQAVHSGYIKLFHSYRDIGIAYFKKIQNHCYVRDALSVYSHEYILVTEEIFKQIGLLALIGLVCLRPSANNDEPRDCDIIADALVQLIINNPNSASPCYDGQVIDISLALYLLVSVGRQEDAKMWLRELGGRLQYTYKIERFFPISTDSFDDLIELRHEGDAELRKELYDCSTIIPTLAQWSIALKAEDIYSAIVLAQEKTFSDVCMQLWYPDKETDTFIYKEAAQHKSGATEAPIIFDKEMIDMAKRIEKLLATNVYERLEEMSSMKHKYPLLILIANRHFRTPFLPEFFQKIINPTENNSSKEISPTEIEVSDKK